MNENQMIGLLWGVGALALVLSSVAARRMSFGLTLRYGLIWAALFAAGFAVFQWMGWQ
jgi:hypothetical protein